MLGRLLSDINGASFLQANRVYKYIFNSKLNRFVKFSQVNKWDIYGKMINVGYT